jgi:nucleoside-diphosphate-sugar epimerase
MRILLTGASGFIGQHILPKLESADHDVHCLSSNLCDYKAVENEVLAADPDIIIHLAARTEVEKSFYEPMTFGEINYLGTVNLVNASVKLSNLKNFMFASTMEVYGWQSVSDDIRDGRIPDVIPAFDEKTPPNPNAPYAVAKHACEQYLKYARRSLRLPFCALRQTNTYGRHDNDFFVVEQIISQMLTGAEVYLGYENPYRNFLFIDDLIDLWVHLVGNCEKINQGEIFTIGPNNPIRIGDLANKIAGILGWQGNIHWNSKPTRPGEIYLLNSNHDLITSKTGWAPKTSLDDGLKRTIEIWKQKVEKI